MFRTWEIVSFSNTKTVSGNTTSVSVLSIWRNLRQFPKFTTKTSREQLVTPSTTIHDTDWWVWGYAQIMATTKLVASGQQRQSSKHAFLVNNAVCGVLRRRFTLNSLHAAYSHLSGSGSKPNVNGRLPKTAFQRTFALLYSVERTKEEHHGPPTIADFLKLIKSAYKSLWFKPDPRSAYLEACSVESDPLQYLREPPSGKFFAGSSGWLVQA